MNIRRCLLVPGVLLALAAPGHARAASRQEMRDYTIATNTFADGLWGAAELKFKNFISTHTNSTLLTNAILYMARSRIGQSNYAGALELLRPVPEGPLATEFIFRAAQARYGMADYPAAIATCSNLLLTLPADSPWLLRAAFVEEQARAKLQDWPGIIKLMSMRENVFLAGVRRAPADPDAANGLLLFAEAWFNRQNHAEAEAVIVRFPPNNLPPELKWERGYLLCRILLDAGQWRRAADESTNLAAWQTGQNQRMETAFLRGQIFEQLGLPSDALREYLGNLAEGLPAPANRRALGKVLALSQPQDAVPLLTNFIAVRPKNPNLDMALLYLGDFYLKAYFAPPQSTTNTPAAPDTNLLQAAITNLERVVRDFPKSEYVGNARLDLGWSDWDQRKYAEAALHFQQAVPLLSNPTNKAAAIFKLADAQFKTGDFAAAASNYNRLIRDYSGLESVTNAFFDLALYQLVKAGIQLNDETSAAAAVDHILKWFPTSGFGERSLFLLGEDLNRKNDYAEARATFSSLLQTFPSTPLQPEIQFAIARSYEQEGDWTNALAIYDRWVANTNFTNDSRLLPQVAFSRALATWKAGQETNALAGMSNFVAQFPADTNLAPEAQYWIGVYYSNHGDYSSADFAWQNLWKLFPDAPLVYQARLAAGGAAMQYDLPQASNDFHVLVADTNTPGFIKNEALFQLGFTEFQMFQRDPTNKLAESLLSDAIAALGSLTNAGSSNSLAPQALGQLGNCWLAWAPLQSDPAAKTNGYADAARMFQAVLNLRPEAAPAVRGQAEFGLGLVSKALDQPDEELKHYLNIVEAGDPSQADAYWVKEAGVEAARWYLDRGQWSNAIKVYQRVEASVPTLRTELDKLILVAEARAAAKTAPVGN